MPYFPELIKELNDALKKRRPFIATDSEYAVPPKPSDRSDYPRYLDGHSVYLKQKVLAQIRAYEAKRELYVSQILAPAPVGGPEPVCQDTPAPAVSGWSFWSLLGY